MDDLTTIPVIAAKAQMAGLLLVGANPIPPNVITLLQTVFAAVVQFLQNCGITPASAVGVAQNPGPFARRRARVTIRGELNHYPDVAGQYTQAQLEAAFWQTSATATEADFTAAYHQLGA